MVLSQDIDRKLISTYKGISFLADDRQKLICRITLGQTSTAIRYPYDIINDPLEYSIVYNPLKIETNCAIWGSGGSFLTLREEITEPQFYIEQEISASSEEYEDTLKGDFSKLGLSPEIIEQARDLFAKYVSAKLSEEGIEADPNIQEKIVNILTLVAYKSGEISLVVQ